MSSQRLTCSIRLTLTAAYSVMPSTMSLLTTPVLQYLYYEAQNHDIEFKAKNFWQNWLIQEFPITQHYTVNSEVSPDGDSKGGSKCWSNPWRIPIPSTPNLDVPRGEAKRDGRAQKS